MKTMFLFIPLWAVAVYLSAGAETLVAEAERQQLLLAERCLRALDDHNGFYALDVYNRAKKSGVSDDNIRSVLLQRIHQRSWPRTQRAPSFAIRAASAALDLFRGDPVVEKAVLEADKPGLDHYPPEYEEIAKRGAMWSVIADYASDELIEEYIYLNKDHFSKTGTLAVFERAVNSRPRFKRDVRAEAAPQAGAPSAPFPISPPARFKPDAWRPERPDQPRESGSSGPGSGSITTVPQEIAVWRSVGLGALGLVVLGTGVWLRRRVVWVPGIVLTVCGGGLYFLRPRADTAPAPPDGAHQIPFHSKEESQRTNPARFKPDAWRPPRPNLPEPAPRERTPYDVLRDEVRQLMAPFHAADPQDREGNQRAKEEAAIKLLAILEKGMPKGCREDNWPGVVSQIIGCQSCSPKCMDRAMEMIGKWIGNPQRTEEETMTALREMMSWRQTDAVNPGTPELERFQRIAAMQEEMFHKASPGTKGTLLIQLEGAKKLVNRPKSQMPEKIVDDKRLLGLMETIRKSAADDPEANGRIMMAVRNRVVSAPDSFPAFEPMAKDILTGGKTDVMGVMQGLEMIASASSSGKPLPSWMDDAGIAREITARHQAAAKSRKDSLAIQRTGFVSTMAMAVIRERMTADPASVAKHYGDVLMLVARDADAGPAFQMEAVRTAVKAGVFSGDEAREKFGGDSMIGKDVNKEYPAK